MQSAIAIEVVARVFIWIFLFSVEVVSIDFVHIAQDNYLYYIVAMAIAIAVFLTTYTWGSDALVKDIREICLYEILLHNLGLLFHFSSVSPFNYIALVYSILFLKFGRLLFPTFSKHEGQFPLWPVFGILGWYASHKQCKQAEGQVAAPARHLHDDEKLIYLYILSCLLSGYCFALLDLNVRLFHLSIIPLLAIPFFYKRVIMHLQRQQALEVAAFDTALAVQEANTRAAMAIAAQQGRQRQELAAKNQQLEQLNQEKQHNLLQLQKMNDALRDACHDLKQPMLVVKNRASALLGCHHAEGRPVPPTHAYAARQLSDGILLLQEYIDDVIYNAKVATQIEAPSFRAIMPCQLLRDIRHEFLPLANEKELYFGLYPGSSAALSLLVRSDLVLLSRILRNLVVNAILHTQSGGLLLAMRKRRQSCLLQVWDTGPGIGVAVTRDGMANFDSFAHWAREAGGRYGADGHGLGINNVRQLCQSLGIEMHLHSRVGHGSVFSFLLPLAEP